jgi:uncharacterized membrane protein YccC
MDFSTLLQQLVNGVQSGAIYALIAVGYTMVYGILRMINFSPREGYMSGAVLGGLMLGVIELSRNRARGVVYSLKKERGRLLESLLAPAEELRFRAVSCGAL